MALPRLVLAKDSPPAPPLRDRSDDELMRLAQAGERHAFAVLVERHAERVMHMCGRFVNDASRGQELAQDTWVMVWRRRDKYAPNGTFLAWLITVARNHCRNELRRRELARTHAAAGELELQSSSEHIDAVLARERQRRVREALTELTPAMREALLLRYGEELRYDEMTEVVGTSESTLRSRVHHGLKMLKQKLEGES
jgi:RNA polymerase sigma-70 factor (ECF subfamily)